MQPREQRRNQMAAKAIFRVTGNRTIHCKGCERTITFALSHVPDVKVMTVSHQTQLIEVMMLGDEPNPERIQAELARLGYETEPV